MRVLVATQETQGQRKNDFHWAKTGELVRFGMDCDGESVDGGCGCRRSLCGTESGKATTTFEVQEQQLSDEEFRQRIETSLRSSGWIGQAWSKPDEDRSMIDDEVASLLEIANHFPVGTILERRGDQIRARRMPLKH